MSASINWRLCIVCRLGPAAPKCFLLNRAALTPVYIPQTQLRRLLSAAGSRAGSAEKSLQPTSGQRQRQSLTEPLGADDLLDADDRRSADPNNELKEYIEYSKVNSWHSAVGRASPPSKPKWKHERLVIGICCLIFTAYIYIRPENSVDEQFGMDEFGKGLFRPNPAMEAHIAATIQTVESRGGDASLYRNQLKILLKEKELAKLKELEKAKGDVKYDPKIHDVKY